MEEAERLKSRLYSIDLEVNNIKEEGVFWIVKGNWAISDLSLSIGCNIKNGIRYQECRHRNCYFLRLDN